jgi:hypothetical protein
VLESREDSEENVGRQQETRRYIRLAYQFINFTHIENMNDSLI